MPKTRSWFWLVFVFMLVAACVSTPPAPLVTPHPIGTHLPTIPETAIPPAIPTVTPQPTPTSTAIPLYVYDGSRSRRSVAPQAQRGAPCGVVDLFDFPLAAPEGDGAGARWPFGYYSSRYEGIHAGEDWVYDNGNNLGQPVYSIGPGTVLYAQPLGWGVDQGTIIVRHAFADGHTILSFYGHLQPESVTLRAGACVTRGQQIGLIGKPRGRPHLHFEIRSIYPDQPGPGYWPSDPARAGWQPPSQYIWDQRVSTTPGVKWTRPFTMTDSLLVGRLISNTLAVIERDQLLGLDARTGRVVWSQPLPATVRQAVVDESGTLLYLTTMSNTLQALDVAGGAGGKLHWQTPFTATRSILLPAPGGGVIAHDGQHLIGFSAQGVEVWRLANVTPPLDWLNDHGDLLFTTGDDQPALYRLNQAGQVRLITALTGRLAASVDHLFVYAPTALYRLSETPELLQTFDRGGYSDGNLVTTADGGVLIAHHGLNGLRLISLRPDGSLRWTRSLQGITASAPRLIVVRSEVYAVTQEGDVWWIDQRQDLAQRVLDGARLFTLPGQVRTIVMPDGTLILDARGGRLIAFDPRQAIVVEDAAEGPSR